MSCPARSRARACPAVHQWFKGPRFASSAAINRSIVRRRHGGRRVHRYAEPLLLQSGETTIAVHLDDRLIDRIEQWLAVRVLAAEITEIHLRAERRLNDRE